MPWDLTQAELQGQATFDDTGFTLPQTPPGIAPEEAPSGRYELPRHSGALDESLKRLESQRIREVNQRNLGYFDAEVQKLDAWADDLKVGLENEVKELDREIKEVRRTATVSATLEEKLHWQKRQRELEDKRNQLRRRIFDRPDEIDGQRNRLIEELEARLSRTVNIKKSGSSGNRVGKSGSC